MAFRRPRCNICSFKQSTSLMPVYHRHHSTHQVRVDQGVEYASKNCSYMCPSCKIQHVAKLPYGLDICISDSTLHNVHYPKEPGVNGLRDTSHVDWLTIPGATVEQLLYAWQVEYANESRPMRLLLVAGLNNFLKGGNIETLTSQIVRFGEKVKYQDILKPQRSNSFAVAPLLLAPKLVWFPENGNPSSNYVNRMDEVEDVNNWITIYNMSNNIKNVPDFHHMGTRLNKRVVYGVQTEFKTHCWNQWRASESRENKLHLADFWRVKMGQDVVKYFQEQRRLNGSLV